jgi:SAM-dependent methyltransferase
MTQQAMAPYGAALVAFSEGDAGAVLFINRNDGRRDPLPVRYFFREPAEFTGIETAALRLCRGRVLDIGAGAGIHTLPLQHRGLRVTALDISPLAAGVMARRGVHDARVADIFEFRGHRFDTLLLLGHGIGMAETLSGLDRLLGRARALLCRDGQLLLHSFDVRRTRDPGHLAYQEANRRAGRYIGEIRMQLEFRGGSGPFCGWLHVDPEMLERRAQQSGWRCEIVIGEEDGDYLARLAPLPT